MYLLLLAAKEIIGYKDTIFNDGLSLMFV